MHSQRIFLATDQTPKPKFVTSVPTTASVQFTQLFTALSAPVASHYHPYPAAFPLQTTSSPGAELRGMAREFLKQFDSKGGNTEARGLEGGSAKLFFVVAVGFCLFLIVVSGCFRGFFGFFFLL